MNKTDLARQYIDAHPEITHDRTLARLMRKENPEHFATLENARDAVRTAKGAKGEGKRKRTPKQQYFKTLTHDTTPPKKQTNLTDAKILILDIETAPISAYVWGLWKQNVYIDQIKSDWFMLTWSAKWLCEPKVLSNRLTGKEAVKQDDKRIVKNLWSVIDEADIVIAHNAAKFDLPRINTRFLTHGLNPTSPYQTIDTLKHLQKNFGFSSNKLDHIARLLSQRRKMDTGGFSLWDSCMKGDEKALAKMEKYNIHDVRILEDVYLILRPWIKPHPNVNLFILDGQEGCPSCGSRDMKEGGVYRTFANNYQALRCNNCGAIGRKRLSEVTVTQKRGLIYSTAK